ncbi:hypothetical protein CONPUDRAFT_143292 [Coniophora puteana RWD-64-598 SS2]|uniref:Uncharacterized protein n=1 Tax=Coniophora puteana (strain RWD-64-598) TaxID=741705 RepID=A0A5M3MX78_CONPW|nr:uncharacterized protein CONPUDRAFT_143292 [Coniophora puteana RWD-64-598 SS2]EIW83374.1 hypothetical protein CONPUDRAFT_143292 [Coniophora puteana RWD-64-598 SS2]
MSVCVHIFQLYTKVIDVDHACSSNKRVLSQVSNSVEAKMKLPDYPYSARIKAFLCYTNPRHPVTCHKLGTGKISSTESKIIRTPGVKVVKGSQKASVASVGDLLSFQTQSVMQVSEEFSKDSFKIPPPSIPEPRPQGEVIKTRFLAPSEVVDNHLFKVSVVFEEGTLSYYGGVALEVWTPTSEVWAPKNDDRFMYKAEQKTRLALLSDLTSQPQELHLNPPPPGDASGLPMCKVALLVENISTRHDLLARVSILDPESPPLSSRQLVWRYDHPLTLASRSMTVYLQSDFPLRVDGEGGLETFLYTVIPPPSERRSPPALPIEILDAIIGETEPRNTLVSTYLPWRRQVIQYGMVNHAWHCAALPHALRIVFSWDFTAERMEKLASLFDVQPTYASYVKYLEIHQELGRCVGIHAGTYARAAISILKASAKWLTLVEIRAWCWGDPSAIYEPLKDCSVLQVLRFDNDHRFSNKKEYHKHKLSDVLKLARPLRSLKNFTCKRLLTDDTSALEDTLPLHCSLSDVELVDLKLGSFPLHSILQHSARSLRGVSLTFITISNAVLRAWLDECGPYLEYLCIHDCRIDPAGTKSEEWAVDATVARMDKLQRLIVRGEGASLRVLTRKPVPEVSNNGGSKQDSGNGTSDNDDNADDSTGERSKSLGPVQLPCITLSIPIDGRTDKEVILQALCTTGWHTIRIDMSECIFIFRRDEAEVEAIGKERGISVLFGDYGPARSQFVQRPRYYLSWAH